MAVVTMGFIVSAPWPVRGPVDQHKGLLACANFRNRPAMAADQGPLTCCIPVTLPAGTLDTSTIHGSDDGEPSTAPTSPPTQTSAY